MTVQAASNNAVDSLDGIAGWVVNLKDALGAPGAGLVMALESLFQPGLHSRRNRTVAYGAGTTLSQA